MLFLLSCDYTESNKQIMDEIDQNMSGQSKLDSIKAEFDRIGKKMDSDSFPEYTIDDEQGLIEK